MSTIVDAPILEEQLENEFPSVDLDDELPPLESGDRLTRDEFERRYDAMPELKKAELIKGVVYVGSPVRIGFHGEPDLIVHTWIGNYVAATPGTQGAGNSSILLADDSMPQPDSLLRIRSECGGQSRIERDYVEGSPEFVGEISASSASYDLHDKLHVYHESGIQEYLVWRVYDRQVDWFIRQQDAYARLTPDAAGVVKSTVFPGLWLDVPALVRYDVAAVLKKLDEGLQTAEHADFVQRLAAAKQD